MKVKELIEELKKFPEDAEVLITDGYEGKFYSGNYLITDFDGKVDIGIGGTNEDMEEEELL